MFLQTKTYYNTETEGGGGSYVIPTTNQKQKHYLRREQITKILTKLKQIKPGSENLTERVNKIKEEKIKLKIQGKDTTELEKELELIKKDLDIGLVSIAKYRLEKVERILKE
jgi:uncharacterized protein YlxW (UPF0749 family)